MRNTRNRIKRAYLFLSFWFLSLEYANVSGRFKRRWPDRSRFLIRPEQTSCNARYLINVSKCSTRIRTSPCCGVVTAPETRRKTFWAPLSLHLRLLPTTRDIHAPRTTTYAYSFTVNAAIAISRTTANPLARMGFWRPFAAICCATESEPRTRVHVRPETPDPSESSRVRRKSLRRTIL